MEVPSIDHSCGKYFTYRDFIECSESWRRSKVDNIPRRLETYRSMDRMALEILDPVVEHFGQVVLTYGFSSAALVKEVKVNKFPNITPAGDQHSGCELNRNNKPICTRLGIAVDFYVAGISSYEVARWIVHNTSFDRLYFYSAHRPFHVSIGPDESRSIVHMDGYRGGRHQPRVMKKETFLNIFS